MRRRTRRYQNHSLFKNVLFTYIKNNIKEYSVVSILFIIGIIIGVIVINNVSEIQELEINEYLTSFINSLKNNQTIDQIALLKTSILKNVRIALLLWFMGSTVIGISIVYLIVIFRGFVLGYTIASRYFYIGNKQRPYFYIHITFATNHISYSVYTCFSSKWHEFI